MKLGQTSVIYFLAKLIGFAVAFVAQIYFARVLGEAVLGQYALVLALVTWLGLGGEVGFPGALTKRLSEGNDPEQFVGAGLTVTGVLMSVVALGVFVFRTRVNSYVGAPVAEVVVLLLFAGLYKWLIDGVLKGSHLVHVSAILSSSMQVITAVGQLTLIGIGFGLSGLLYGYAVGHLVTATVGLWFLRLRPALPRKHHVRSLFDYAKFFWLGGIRSRSFDTIDIAVLGFFVTQGLIGIYSIAWSIGKFLDIFSVAISSTLFPEMSKLSAAKSPSTVANLVEEALTYAGLLLIPGLVGAVVIGDRLLLLYGESFTAGADILVLLIAALGFYTYAKQLLTALNAIDRPDLSFRVNSVIILTNVLLNIVLVWQFGWLGAAVATGLSAIIGLIAAFYYVSEQVLFTVPTTEIGYQGVAAVSMGVVISVIRRFGESRWIAEYNIVFVALLVGTGAVVYFGTLFTISSAFRTTVTNNLPVGPT